jgi:hypothetical protein
MANDGQIVFEVTADGKHAIADIRDITKAIQQETGKWDTAAKQSTDNIGNQFTRMLKKLTAGFTAAKVGKALLDIGKEAIAAASDLEEVQNVVDVTFGQGASKIESWSKAAGSQFGLTETQAKRFTSTLGAMMKSAGLSGDKIVDMSTDLAGLTADMASFYNLDFDTAFQKIRSGISGETEPLKQLGINMSVANLNAFALQQGLSKTFDQMSQGEQTMLRYQYLMQATADAQGDFSRTSDGYANSVRKLQTNVDQLKTTLGKGFIDIVTEATGFLNTFIESLTPDESKRTVLDDFADIDLQTEKKLADIQATAEQARELTEQLDAIGGSKADKAGSKVQQIANGLAEINLDKGKTGVVKDFISTLADNIEVLAAVQGTDAEGAKAWLDGIAESANKLDPDDAAGWASLIASIKEGLPGLENTDFGAAFFSSLGDGFTDVEQKSSVLQWAVDALGNKTNKTAQEQAVWLETCQRLVKTIPGLSSIINTETGEIKGGTDAVKEYIKAWEDGQTKLAMLGALEQKESAISSRFADLPGLQLDMALAEKRLRDRNKQIQALMEKYGLDEAYNNFLRQGDTGLAESALANAGATQGDLEAMAALSDGYDNLVDEADKASSAYKLQADALEEAKQAIEEYRATIDETHGTIEEAADASEQFWIDNAENIKTVVAAAQDALTALSDYAKGVHDAARQSIDSVTKSLGRVDYQAYGKQIEKISELTQKQAQYKVGSDEWKKLQGEIDKANESLISTDNIYKNLESQSQFLEAYIANMRKAREMGVDSNLLAELSDGSTESAEYLDALVNDKTGKTIEEINAQYQKIQEQKAALASELADQQLSVDQTYQSLAEKAKEAVAALDMQGEAAANSGATVSGIAQGISEHVSEVSGAVDSIISELERLNGYGIDIDFGGFGKITFTTSTGKTEGSGRMGIPLVPHDDYIARLHEGERVLTAQENQIWSALRNGGIAGFDLEALGGVMRDNVHAGGNVYLDGRTVGQVISEQQGKSYRQLQRSGWQS